MGGPGRCSLPSQRREYTTRTEMGKRRAGSGKVTIASWLLEFISQYHRRIGGGVASDLETARVVQFQDLEVRSRQEDLEDDLSSWGEQVEASHIGGHGGDLYVGLVEGPGIGGEALVSLAAFPGHYDIDGGDDKGGIRGVEEEEVIGIKEAEGMHGEGEGSGGPYDSVVGESDEEVVAGEGNIAVKGDGSVMVGRPCR
ncbi:hypothetical protein ZIOFF_034154 [Zingiber officinale]|uniref:Uncharacterized protein n=1 Tax=Zingiber officinale TaxID=94328 RepID=A0A8J5GRJ8_ZINOF|nr:hypothetical protein ZIOFF_034154 [Zingiber officinale]